MINERLMRFLLVEDDEDHADLVMRSLWKSRVANKVDHVADGAAAMAYLRQEGEYRHSARPDIVLLDLNLPKLSGHEVLKQIKDDENLRSIPVVVLTTSKVEADRMKAYQCHANSYLVKPVDFERFRKMIDELNLYWGIWNVPSEDEAA